MSTDPEQNWLCKNCGKVKHVEKGQGCFSIPVGWFHVEYGKLGHVAQYDFCCKICVIDFILNQYEREKQEGTEV